MNNQTNNINVGKNKNMWIHLYATASNKMFSLMMIYIFEYLFDTNSLP